MSAMFNIGCPQNSGLLSDSFCVLLEVPIRPSDVNRPSNFHYTSNHGRDIHEFR